MLKHSGVLVVACRNAHSTELIVLTVTIIKPMSADATTDSTAAFDNFDPVPNF